MNLPSAQIASHLNKAPIEIWSLPLLTGFGSDRQPEHQCLFRFHQGQDLSSFLYGYPVLIKFLTQVSSLKYLNTKNLKLTPHFLCSAHTALPLSLVLEKCRLHFWINKWNSDLSKKGGWISRKQKQNPLKYLTKIFWLRENSSLFKTMYIFKHTETKKHKCNTLSLFIQNMPSLTTVRQEGGCRARWKKWRD